MAAFSMGSRSAYIFSGIAAGVALPAIMFILWEYILACAVTAISPTIWYLPQWVYVTAFVLAIGAAATVFAVLSKIAPRMAALSKAAVITTLFAGLPCGAIVLMGCLAFAPIANGAVTIGKSVASPDGEYVAVEFSPRDGNAVVEDSQYVSIRKSGEPFRAHHGIVCSLSEGNAPEIAWLANRSLSITYESDVPPHQSCETYDDVRIQYTQGSVR